MIIKVCGMRQPDNIKQVEQLGVDGMGFIFYPKSPRYVEYKPAYLPKRAKRVGVFVNDEIEHILEKAESFRLSFIQLHGNESPHFCERLMDSNLKVIKAFSI